MDKEEGDKEKKEKVDELTKKFPVIDHLREGKTVNNGATKEEMEVVPKYMELKFDMQRYIERKHYFRVQGLYSVFDSLWGIRYKF